MGNVKLRAAERRLEAMGMGTTERTAAKPERCAVLLATLLQYARAPATPNSPRWVAFMVPDDFLAEAEAALGDALAEAPATWNKPPLRSLVPPGFEGAYFGCEDDCAPD